jgi:DNA methylase
VDPFPSTTGLDLEEMAGHMQAWSAQVAEQVCPGAMIYWFTEWRQMGVLTETVQPVIGVPRDMIAWVRSDARPGTLYRSRYEQVAVFVVGDGPPERAAQLGRGGRHRTNVWTYPGGDRGKDRRTGRKPVALVIDILKDCSAPGDIVLDPFAGSGTTMIAAERTGRRARLIERDPRWCDVILRRWEKLTKVPARHAESSTAFAEIAKERSSDGTHGEN